MCAVASLTSWGLRPASWRQRQNLVSSRASGVPITQEWFGVLAQRRRTVRRRRSHRSSRRSHPACNEAVATARTGGIEVLEFLERRIVARAKNLGEAALLARDIHVLPEFLGNRSPFADPVSRAVVAGMDLDTDIGSMERLFVAGLCGLAYGLADVVEAFRSHGVDSDLMVISGGAGKFAGPPDHGRYDGPDRCVPETQEPVLLGAAILGAVAGRCCGSIGEGHGLDVGDRPANRNDSARNGGLSPHQAAGSQVNAAGSGKPRCDAGYRIDRRG